MERHGRADPLIDDACGICTHGLTPGFGTALVKGATGDASDMTGNKDDMKRLDGLRASYILPAAASRRGP
jgi:hypothetical protein